MASLDLGALKIKIELDNKEANKGLKDTQTAVEEVDKKGSNRLKNFGKSQIILRLTQIALIRLPNG